MKQANLVLNAPQSPQLTAYEPYDDNQKFDEPVFEQLILKHVATWPTFGTGAPWRFDTTKLEQCTLIGQPIEAFKMWDCVIVRTDMSANRLFGASLLRTEFLGCRITGVQLGEAWLRDVVFQNCKLNMSSFRKAKLERVVFENCMLDDVDFNEATLIDVIFTHCEMRQTDFDRSMATRVDMTGSNISAIKGVRSLKHVQIKPEQMLELAPLMCAEIGVIVRD